MPIDGLEKCVARFLNTTRLSSEDYAGRLKELGWDCLVLRALKKSLEFTYRLHFGLVALTDEIFRHLETRLPLSTIAGNTRQASRLHDHICPIESVGSTMCGIDPKASKSSFSNRMAMLWNSLSLPDAPYPNVCTFRSALQTVKWKDLSWVQKYLDADQY